ncbi:MAG: hypothetical protein ACOVRK_14000, partial [Chryseobacterium taeanense]
MSSNNLQKTFLLLLILFLSVSASAQIGSGISMEIRDESSLGRDRIISTIVEIKNNSQNNFKGKLFINVPSGFRNISGNMNEIDVNAGDNIYLPVKFLINSNAGFGESEIVFTLKDMLDHEV